MGKKLLSRRRIELRSSTQSSRRRRPAEEAGGRLATRVFRGPLGKDAAARLELDLFSSVLIIIPDPRETRRRLEVREPELDSNPKTHIPSTSLHTELYQAVGMQFGQRLDAKRIAHLLDSSWMSSPGGPRQSQDHQRLRFYCTNPEITGLLKGLGTSRFRGLE